MANIQEGTKSTTRTQYSVQSLKYDLELYILCEGVLYQLQRHGATRRGSTGKAVHNFIS